MTAAHKAAISAGLKRYWAEKKKGQSEPRAQRVEGGKVVGTISQSDAALIMFGSRAIKKTAPKKNKPTKKDRTGRRLAR
jgi:hypothetical protein